MRVPAAVAVAVAGIVAAAASAFPSHPEQAPAYRLQRVASGFEQPVALASTPSEPNRVYVVEQGGVIQVLENGRKRPQPFLDIRGRITSGGEQGLLGLAFHPNYKTTRRFYVNYTDTRGDTRVVEFRSNGTVGLPATARQLLFVDQPYSNHNGGHVTFGPDGRLWVGLGDGGSGGDPENRAQNMGTKLGKMLSINVATKHARIEALGLRNPWRYSFDRGTGDLYIGDVGQGEWEEISFTPRRSPGLENYGWDVYEGRAQFEQKRPSRGKLVFPVAVYGRSGGNCSVTGGFVYRGKGVPTAVGRYFYGDYCSGIVWSLAVRSGKARGVRREPFRVDGLTTFGEDARGELYAVSHGGTIYRLAR